MKRTRLGLVFTALLFGTLPASTGYCAPRQAALRVSQCCCAPSADDACAMACARGSASRQQHLRAAATEPTLKTFFASLASHGLTIPAIQLAAADISSTAPSPAPIPRRYLRTRALRL